MILDHVRAGSAQDRDLLGAALVWAAIWLGTAVVLKGGGEFADMIPLLTIGTVWFLAVRPALSARSSKRPGPD